MAWKVNKAIVAAGVFVLVCVVVLTVGALGRAPGVAPASVPKTLDQVEPRVPISSLPFAIHDSGSYYLIGNLTGSVPDQNGIEVDANNVTIDLMGYSLIGTGSSLSNGVSLMGTFNVEIRNGTVVGWAGDGIYEKGGTGHRILGVRLIGNDGSGLFLSGTAHVVRDCVSLWNGEYGIAVADASHLDRNTAYGNYIGVSVGSGCTVANSVSQANWAAGLIVGDGCTVIGNTLDDNQWPTNILPPPADLGSGTGLIVAGDGCLVRDNTLRGNTDTNIRVKGTHCSIENNLVTKSQYGIYFEETGNFYANNRASQNTTNYSKAPVPATEVATRPSDAARWESPLDVDGGA